MNTIESTVAGTFTQNEELANWWHSKPIEIGLIGSELPVTLMDFDPEADEKFMEEADTALKNFLSLNNTYRLQIVQPIFENFVEFLSYVGEDDIPEKMKGSSPLSIWNYVYPTAVFVNRRPRRDQDIYIVLACECEWEKEHGLQLVFRQGKKLTRVSDQDGHLTEADAYDKPDKDDKLLSAF